jgi:hypothetical protein
MTFEAIIMSGSSTGTEYTELVGRYKKLRRIVHWLQNSVLPDYLSRNAYIISGERLGMWRENAMVLGEQHEVSVLADYCIYDYKEHGANAVSKYISDCQANEESDERLVLKAMSQSFYTLVRIKEVLPEVGVLLYDLLGDKDIFLIDIALSRTADPGFTIATRILPFEGFAMTSGAALPVHAETLSAITDYLNRNYETGAAGQPSANVPNREYSAADIIRLCLEAGSSSYIKYEDVEAEPTILPLRSDKRLGRNDPCPCGSGRKYKRCCGRYSP